MVGIDQPHGLAHGRGTVFQVDGRGERMIIPVVCEHIPLIINCMIAEIPLGSIVIGVGDGRPGLLVVPLGRTAESTGEKPAGSATEGKVVFLDESGSIILDEGRQVLFRIGLQHDMQVIHHRADTQNAHFVLLFYAEKQGQKNEEIPTGVENDISVDGSLVNVVDTSGAKFSSLHSFKLFLKHNNMSIFPVFRLPLARMCCFSMLFNDSVRFCGVQRGEMRALWVREIAAGLCPLGRAQTAD